MDKIRTMNKKIGIGMTVLAIVIVSFAVVFSYIEKEKHTAEADTMTEEHINEMLQSVKDTLRKADYQNIPLDAGSRGTDTKSYNISSVNDWLALMVLSSESSLEGYTFYINLENNGDSNATTDIDYDLTGTNFIGIAPKGEYPFKGKLYATIQGMSVTTDVPIFYHLDVSAVISGTTATDSVTFILSEGSNANAGLARVLMGSGTLPDNSYRNVSVSGKVNSMGGNAGSVFGKISNQMGTPLTIQSSNLALTNNITSVTGLCAGGLAGTIEGNVELILDDISKWDGESLTISSTSLSSVDVCAGGVAGIISSCTDESGNTTYQPKVTLNSVIKISSMISAQEYAGGIAGWMKDVTIQSSNADSVGVEQSGTVSAKDKGSGDLTVCAGGIAGYMENVSFTHTGNFLVKANISMAEYAGGICGIAKNVTFSEGLKIVSDSSVIEAGSVSTTQYLGGLFGEYGGLSAENANKVLKDITVRNLTLKSNTSNSTPGALNLGGVVGLMCSDGVDIGAENTEDAEQNVVVKNVYVSSYGGNEDNSYFGGVIGKNQKADLQIQNVSVQFYDSENTSIQQGAWTAGSVGGLIGYTETGCTIQNAKNMIVAIDEQRMDIKILGGLIAKVQDTTKASEIKIQIRTVEFGATHLVAKTGDSVKIGGLVGALGTNSVLCLEGNINLSNIQTSNQSTNIDQAKYAYYGYVVGKQNNCLVYINPTSCTTEGYQYGLSLPETTYADEIGNYGSVYRNGNWDTTSYTAWNSVTDNEKSQWLITQNGESVSVGGTVGKASDKYQMDSVGDMMRLAIALNTEGIYGLNCFDPVSSDDDLLKAVYVITKNLDLTKTGIITINKNALNSNTQVEESYAFCGSLEGAGKDIQLTYASRSFYQANIGLFSTIKNATIQKLTLRGTVSVLDNSQNNGSFKNKKLQNAGGIAAYSFGSLTIESITAAITVNDGVQKSDSESYGGLVGYCKTDKDATLTLNNITCTATMQYHLKNHTVGGLIGYLDTINLVKEKPLTINMNTINLSGDIQIVSIEEDNIKIGGLIAQIGSESKIEDLVFMKMNTICINNFYIRSDISKDNRNLGGLIGYQWHNVNATITSLTVTNSGLNVEKFKKLYYGGLWNTVTGKMSLKTVNIFGTKFICDSSQSNNGLLIRNGQNLYLTLDEYTLGENVNVSNVGDNFDEIVGFNKGNWGNLSSDSESGGIVSIVTNTAYGLYQNQIVAQGNPNTRYYYNLETDMAAVLGSADKKTTITQINNVGELLQWHLAHYANTDLRKYFNIADNYSVNGENITFGTFDLGDASYYPTTISGAACTGGKLTFHGQEFDTSVANANGGTKLLYTYQEESENYQIQSGLFKNVTQSTIQDFELAGAVTAYQAGGAGYSGGLIAGKILGGQLEKTENGYKTFNANPTTITNIKLNNFAVSHSGTDPYATENWKSYYGLMVCEISEGAVVNFDRIQMTNYTTSDHVAAALIGKVGATEDITNKTPQGMKLSFTNMDIADVADTVESPDSIKRTAGDKVLAYASFIYFYDYFENTSNGVYTFYLDDYKYGNKIETKPEEELGFVTLGQEIGDTVPFYDEGLDTPIKAYHAEHFTSNFTFNENNYKPYVYQKKKIEVNPKKGHITEGCGTYDSPYIIDKTSQLISLFQYLSDRETYKTSLDGWRVNEYGQELENPAERVTPIEKCYNISSKTYADLTGDAYHFPSIEELSEAYYLIRGDLDLTQAKIFTGLGTKTLPFTGVLVGDIKTDTEDSPENQYTITMPKFDNAVTNFGLIQYAKGAVVQNVKIVLSTPTTEAENTVVKNHVKVTGYGSGVMAYVSGGDNVISNVTVEGCMEVDDSAKVGGYVGCQELGAVILRDMQESSLSEFSVSGSSSYVGRVAGYIQDGFLCTDDAGTSSVCNSYQTDNATFFNSKYKGIVSNGVLSGASITVTPKDGGGTTFELDTAEDILLLSLALNSGALNYNQEGYDIYAKWRNTDYDYVGKITQSDITDGSLRLQAYQNAIYYDNKKTCAKTGTAYGDSVYHPYVYRYFVFGSGVNVSKKLNQNITCTLQAGTYDLSIAGIKECFHGIGARYGDRVWGSHCLQGNFVGAGSATTIIKLDIEHIDGIYAGLFNRLSWWGSYEIKGFQITGSVSNTAGAAGGIAAYTTNADNPYKISDVKAKDFVVTAKNTACSAFIAYSQASLTFSNCDIQNVSFQASTHKGGFVGKLDQSQHTLKLDNCNIQGLSLGISSDVMGGFIGESNGAVFINQEENAKSTIQDLTIPCQYWSYCGGVIGNLSNSSDNAISNIEFTELEIKHSNDNDCVIGGVVANCNNCTKLTISNIQIGSKTETGSILLGHSGTQHSNQEYVGGLIGKHEKGILEIQNCSLVGAEISQENYTTQLLNARYVGGVIGFANTQYQIKICNTKIENVLLQANMNNGERTNGAGGIIGATANTNTTETLLQITDTQITNLKIIRETATSTNNVTVYMGGLIGYLTSPAEISGFSITNLNIGSDGYCGESGGIVGMIASNGQLTISKSDKEPVNINTIQESMICGGVAGGIFGHADGNRDSSIFDVSISNTSIVAQYHLGTAWKILAGGIGGRIGVGEEGKTENADNTQYTYHYQNISIQQTVITGYQSGNKLQNIYLGGLIGARYKTACGERYYDVKLEDVLIGLQENNKETSEKVFPTYESVKDGTHTLYLTTTENGTSYTQTALSTSSKNQVDVKNTTRIGMFTGIDISDRQSYLIKVKVSYTEEGLEGFRPVMDVGTTTKYATMTEAYASYRDKYHVIYSDYTDKDNNNVLDTLERLDEIWEEHCYENQTADNKTNNDYRMDISYGQTMIGENNEALSNEAMQRIYQTTYKDENGYLSVGQDSNGSRLPMIVVTSWEYDVNNIINTYLNIFTNNGGAVNVWKDSGCIDVAVQEMKVTNGAVSALGDSEAKKGIITFDKDTYQFQASSSKYDTFTDSKNLTYTEIVVTYQYDAQNTFVLKIPIHVKELLGVQAHMQYLPGTHYSVNGISPLEACPELKSATVECQNQYTIYSEYIYNSVREGYQNAILNKTFFREVGTTVDNKYKNYYKGTKLTLIDVTDGGKAYYYKVSDENTSAVSFTDFKDEDGASYSSKDMGIAGKTGESFYGARTEYTDICGKKHKNVGVEQFLIIVDETEVEEEVNLIYDLKVESLRTDNAMMYRNMNYEKGCHVQITEIPGLIQAISGGNAQYTYLNSTITCSQQLHTTWNSDAGSNKVQILNENPQISENGRLYLSGSMYVGALSDLFAGAPNYWNSAKNLESREYLELALFMVDSEGKKIQIPKGTKVTLDMTVQDKDSENDDATLNTKYDAVYYSQGGYYLYCFNNDGNKQGFFNLSTLTSNTKVEFSIQFDFSTADLSEIDSVNYTVKMELLKTPNYEYPRSGTVVDETDCGTVQGIAKKELGFALMPTENLTLGINGYQGGETDSGNIPFKTKIDFSDYIDSDKLSQYAGKYYTYTFVIKRKELQNDKGVYVTDSALQLENTDNSKVKILYQNSESKSDAITICQTVQYTEEQITALREKGYVMEEDFILDASKLLSAENKYMTNYQVTCYVTITDSEPSQSKDQLIETSISNDFFIFTVAKLKTDMDYSH